MSENELIAEFMGLVRVEANSTYNKAQYYLPGKDRRYKGRFVGYYDSLQYHEYWDWLMPVVNNIESIVADPNASVMVGWDHWNNQFDGTINTDIRVTYQIVVEFIKWYNQQKQ